VTNARRREADLYCIVHWFVEGAWHWCAPPGSRNLHADTPLRAGVDGASVRDPFFRLTRRQRWRTVAWRLRRALGAPAPRSPARMPEDAPAHLLLVGVDTLRADHLGCQGYGRETSPRLDHLVSTGTRFADVTAPAPWTLPSFTGALTGLMPGLHGAHLGGDARNMDKQAPGRVRPGVVTLAAHLQAQGYRTAAFYANQFFAFGLAESFGTHAYHNLPAADMLAMAHDWLRRNADRPCFCFVLVNDPHEPTTPPWNDLAPFLPAPAPTDAQLADLARWGGTAWPHLGRAADAGAADVRAALDVKIAIYDATIRQVDRAIGNLQDALQSCGLADRTLVSVFSDHGEEFLDHAAWAAQWDHDPRGLRGIGHGQSHFQELLHVPWLAWGTGVPKGVVVEAPASLLDLAPTVLDWLGLPPLPPVALPGDVPPGLASALVGRSLAAAATHPAPAATDAPARLRLAEAIAYGPDLVAVRQGNWKFIAARDGRPLALFDLAADPAEQHDAAAAHPDVLARMTAVVEAWRASGAGACDTVQGAEWGDLDGVVRERLRDMGYSE
jgi:arylsulfatase A-like enzyme